MSCEAGFLAAALKAQILVLPVFQSSAWHKLVLCVHRHQCIKHMIGRDRPPDRLRDRPDLIA